MDKNLFTDGQIEYLYSDSGFLSFVNQYFSSISSCIQRMSMDGLGASGEDVGVYMRIVLANIDVLYRLVSDLESCLSMVNTEMAATYRGQIQGRLDIAAYARGRGQIRHPREYPCVVKAKTYVTPENTGVIFIIGNVLELLDMFKRFLRNISAANHKHYSEFGVIERYSEKLRMFSGKAYFAQCAGCAKQMKRAYGSVFPKDQRNIIYNRMRKGKIRNANVYREIFEWYDLFGKGYATESILRKTDILRYSEDFSNKLFELWCLYGVKEAFVMEFEAALLEERGLMEASGGYLFKLSVPTGGVIEIYYQKGAGLYWEEQEDLAWRYCGDGVSRALRGVPDISVRYIARMDSLIMIDVKNRVRDAGANSEEIYKMIGYFSNFRKAFEEKYNCGCKRQGALLFRNDHKAYEESVENGDGYGLRIFSIGVGEDEERHKAQFKKLCKYILDVQGDGTTAEVMGSLSRSRRALAGAAKDGDDFIYALSERNHGLIEQLLSAGELAKKLPCHRERLEKDHFPHVWGMLSDKTRNILAMAECLYSDVNACDRGDYAPICLEYCRALEVELNESVFRPFRDGVDTVRLARRNHFYDKLNMDRDMTLGECVYLLQKCAHGTHPTNELKEYIQNNIKGHAFLLGGAVDALRDMNENIRRLSAHTTVMSYGEMVLTRQKVLGIGYRNLFYVLRDPRPFWG